MSTTAALVKLPCILAVTAGIHTSLTVPGYASRAELVPLPGLQGIQMACGPALVAATKVRKANYTLVSHRYETSLG